MRGFWTKQAVVATTLSTLGLVLLSSDLYLPTALAAPARAPTPGGARAQASVPLVESSSDTLKEQTVVPQNEGLTAASLIASASILFGKHRGLIRIDENDGDNNTINDKTKKAPFSAVDATLSTVPDLSNWSCRPSKEHPRPVVMLHGLASIGYESSEFLAKQLQGLGYCVFELLFGTIPGFPMVGGMADIRDSAKELATFVDKVLNATGAEKVDLIGHSEGSVVTRWYVKFLGGDHFVDSVVSIAPVGHGTALLGLVAMSKVTGWYDVLAGFVHESCIPCTQVLEGSDLLTELYADGQETVPGVRYLNLLTKHDIMVTPYTNGLIRLDPPSPSQKKALTSSSVGKWEETQESRNLIIEDHCPEDEGHANHFDLFQSPFAFYSTDAFLSRTKSDLTEVIQCSMPNVKS